MENIVINATYTIFCFDTMVEMLGLTFHTGIVPNIRGIRQPLWDSMEQVTVKAASNGSLWIQDCTGHNWWIPPEAIKQRVA